MKNSSKKSLALLLALIMLLSATPISYFAAAAAPAATAAAQKEHKHKKVTTVKKATLSSNGLITVKCSDCKKTLSKKTIAKIKTVKLKKESYDYNGKAVTPTLTVKDSKGKALKSGKDYTVTYLANKKPGKATAVVTFKGNYSGTKRISFSIVPRINADIFLEGSKSKANMTVFWDRVNGAFSYTVSLYSGKKLVQTVKTASTEAKFEKLSKTKKYRITFTAKNLFGKDILSDSASFSVPKTQEPENPLSPSSTSKEIVALYNKAVNTLKEEKNVKIHKTSDVDVKCTQASPAMFESIYNKSIEERLVPTDETLTFKNGKAVGKGTGGLELNKFVTPSGRKATLSPKYVQSASAKVLLNGNTVLTIALKKEVSSFDGKNNKTANGNRSVIDVTDAPSISLNIVNAKMTYTGTQLKATLNKDGKLIKLEINMPMKIALSSEMRSASAASFKANASFEGNRNETYSVTY